MGLGSLLGLAVALGLCEEVMRRSTGVGLGGGGGRLASECRCTGVYEREHLHELRGRVRYA